VRTFQDNHEEMAKVRLCCCVGQVEDSFVRGK